MNDLSPDSFTFSDRQCIAWRRYRLIVVLMIRCWLQSVNRSRCTRRQFNLRIQAIVIGILNFRQRIWVRCYYRHVVKSGVGCRESVTEGLRLEKAIKWLKTRRRGNMMAFTTSVWGFNILVQARIWCRLSGKKGRNWLRLADSAHGALGRSSGRIMSAVAAKERSPQRRTPIVPGHSASPVIGQWPKLLGQWPIFESLANWPVIDP